MDVPSVSTVRALLAAAHEDALSVLVEQYSGDSRAGVIAAVQASRRRLARADAERRRLEALEAAERELASRGLQFVAGVDEVGRGALAGPVTAAACVLPGGAHLPRLADSKRLAPDVRIALDGEIRACALAVSVAHVPADEIDHLGIAGATAKAMRLALGGLAVPIDHALVDGLPVDLGVQSTAVVAGDATVRVIAAASILAKVARDALMVGLGDEHPGWDLAINKGYGTPAHLAVLAERGPSPIHRLSFTPCGQAQLF